jgi:hypothetical protein
MRNLSQVYSSPKLLDMTPFSTSHLGHNNQALTKRFVYQGTRSNIQVLLKPKSQTTRLKCERGHDSPCWPPLLTNPLGCTSRHVHVPASSPCLPPLSGSSFLNPKVGVRFWFELTQDGSICPMPFENPICTYTQDSHDTISWKFLAFISFATWCGTFYVKLCPIKRKVMFSSRSMSLLCRPRVEFFYGFLGMLHVGFIHSRCLYWMVSFPLN